jgi:hypothetical protein
VSPSFVHSDGPSKEVVTCPLVPVQQVLCTYITLHPGQCMGYPRCCSFAVPRNVAQNVEHGCDVSPLQEVTIAQPIEVDIQQRSKVLTGAVVTMGSS